MTDGQYLCIVCIIINNIITSSSFQLILPVWPAAMVIHSDRDEGDDSLSSQPIRKHHLLTHVNVWVWTAEGTAQVTTQTRLSKTRGDIFNQIEQTWRSIYLWWPVYLAPLMCPTPLQPGVGHTPWEGEDKGDQPVSCTHRKQPTVRNSIICLS